MSEDDSFTNKYIKIIHTLLGGILMTSLSAWTNCLFTWSADQGFRISDMYIISEGMSCFSGILDDIVIDSEMHGNCCLIDYHLKRNIYSLLVQSDIFVLGFTDNCLKYDTKMCIMVLSGICSPTGEIIRCQWGICGPLYLLSIVGIHIPRCLCSPVVMFPDLNFLWCWCPPVT